MKLSKLAKILLISGISYIGLHQNSYAPNTPFIKTELEKERKTVLIDPGHGGDEYGFTIKKVKEKDINLNIAHYLKPLLEEQGYNVVLTREKDEEINKKKIDYNEDKKIDLKDEIIARKNLGEIAKADYFLSLHNNADQRSKWTNGLEIWTFGYRYKKELTNQKTDYHPTHRARYKNEEASEFAQKMEKTFIDAGFKTMVACGDFGILKENPVEKSIIIEYGYLTNEDDFRRMTSEDFQKYCAEITAKYFKENETSIKE